MCRRFGPFCPPLRPAAAASARFWQSCDLRGNRASALRPLRGECTVLAKLRFSLGHVRPPFARNFTLLFLIHAGKAAKGGAAWAPCFLSHSFLPAFQSAELGMRTQTDGQRPLFQSSIGERSEARLTAFGRRRASCAGPPRGPEGAQAGAGRFAMAKRWAACRAQFVQASGVDTAAPALPAWNRRHGRGAAAVRR